MNNENRNNNNDNYFAGVKHNTDNIEGEHNEIYDEPDEEEELNTKMAEEINDYQPFQIKS